MRPGVELETRVGLRDELGELAGRVSRPCAVRPVGASCGGLADRDLCFRVACLEACVRSGVQLRVVRGRDRATAAVELGCKESLEVWLVPDRPEADERVSVEATGVPRRDRASEGREVADVLGHAVRGQAAVCPLRGSRDREHDLLVVLLRCSYGLIDVVEAVRRVERVGRRRRALWRGEVPLDEKADDCRAVLGRALDAREPVRDPPVARVVVEADPHALSCLGLRRHHRRGHDEHRERGQGESEANGDVS